MGILDKVNKQVRSMLREERSKTTKQEATIVIKEAKQGEWLRGHAELDFFHL